MKRTTVLRIALLLLCVWGRAESFSNIDTREPIIRLSPAGQDESHSEEYGEDFFGFAIALHQTEPFLNGDGAREAAAKTRIIVGAPMGTYPGGLPLDDPGESALPRTGLVYSCSVIDDQCEGVVGDTDDFDDDNDALNGAGRLFDHRPNANILTEFGTYLQAEQKIGQLLGATVYSRDGTLVVCAPAWTSTGTYDSNLTDPDPTRNFPVVSNSLPQGRCYTTDSNLVNLKFLDPCNLRGEADITIDQGYCTAGTDVDMLEPGRFIIGTPGYSFGYGAVFYGRTQEDMMTRNDATRGLGNILQPIPGGGLAQILETSQGFQVTTGYITMSREDIDTPPCNVLASVPRFDSTTYRGRVDVYDAREVGGNISQLLSVTAEGQQIAEHFGYALDAVDLNDDDYDEVIVGAPMYSKIDTSSEVKVEVGRVYVFMNTGGNLSAIPIVLEGTAPRGRFGMSVLGIGDIDRDGFNDIAVGAPYEEVGNSTGVVYLYYGSDDEAVFRSQTPAMITSQSIADSVSNINYLRTFGFSLAALDVDNNQYNDLAIGTLDSGAVVLLRSRPIVMVEATLQSLTDEVARSETSCRVAGTGYACFDVTVDLSFSGVNVPDEIEVTVILSEVRSKDEQRIFFDDDPEAATTTISTDLDNTGGSITATVYLLNGITDSSSPLTLVAEVQQNEIASSPGDGAPAINDLINNFIIREPPSSITMVNLTNNCGPERECVTDFALSFNSVQYLPDRGLNYETIEVGGVNEVIVQLTLSNNGDEDAIVLLLDISHSVEDVFTDQVEIMINGVSTQCRQNEICNVGELFPGQPEIVFVTMPVRSGVQMGDLKTTFTLESSVTRDTEPNNNMVMQEFTVDGRANLTVSMFFPQDMTMYTDSEPENPAQRSDVGSRVPLEVRVSNVRSTTINRAELKIYYPASNDETGEFFYLLPNCDVTASVTQGGEITCDTSVLGNIDPLLCDDIGSRRRRHTVAPTVKQRRRRAREARAAGRAGEAGLRRSKRQSEVSSLDCSTMQPACLLITCTISQLRGLSANEARITLSGFVDERFFFDKDVVYRLNAFATVTFNETTEGIIDQRERPDEASARITIRPPTSTSSSTGGSLSVTIIVIIAVIVGAILLIVVVAVILYCCGFFKRKKKPGEEGEEVEGTAPSAPSSNVKPPVEATTL